MALSPLEQELAMERNMAAKTGKTLAQWLELLKKSGPEHPAEQLKWLKEKKGLGHFQAALVVKRRQAGGRSEYENGEALIDRLFAGEQKSLRGIYTTLVAAVMKLGADIQIKPCKTYIPFYRKRQFLIVKPGKGMLYVGLPVTPDRSNPEQLPSKGLGMPEKIGMAIALKSRTAVSVTLMNEIRKAYEAN